MIGDRGGRVDHGAPIAARPRARGIRRGAYLLPSLFTMGNMVFGFYAIICGLGDKPDFVRASLFILLAAALDSVDGRIARMTGTESDFGREFDSLADVITFGVAPGMLVYLWGLQELNPDTWLLSVFYMVCTATRLARAEVAIMTSSPSAVRRCAASPLA